MTSHLTTDLADGDGVIHACVHSAGEIDGGNGSIGTPALANIDFRGAFRLWNAPPTPVPAAEPQSFACGPRKGPFCPTDEAPLLRSLELSAAVYGGRDDGGIALVRHGADEMPLIGRSDGGCCTRETITQYPDIRPISGIRSVYGEAREQPPTKPVFASEPLGSKDDRRRGGEGD